MSGKRQHYIPRFLLEGFASHQNGAEVFGWVYRRDRPPFNTNTRNVAVEGRFYSEGDDHSADDAITAIEGELSGITRDLRRSVGQAVDSSIAARLVAHLEIRSRHLRESFAGTVAGLLDFVFGENKQALWAEHITRRIAQDPRLTEAIAKGLAARGVPRSAVPAIHNAILPSAISQIRPVIFQYMAELRRRAPELVPGAIRKGHLKALRDEPSPSKRIAWYATLPYRVELLAQPIPLGDSIVFSERRDGSVRPLLTEPRDLRGIALPLASDRVLVGGEFRDVSSESLRRGAVRCSLEFFVAAERTDELDSLAQHIGDNAALLTDEEMAGLLDEVLERGESDD